MNGFWILQFCNMTMYVFISVLKGSLLVGLLILFACCFTQFYNMEIRSGLIRQEFEDSVTSIDQIDLLTTPAFGEENYKDHIMHGETTDIWGYVRLSKMLMRVECSYK